MTSRAALPPQRGSVPWKIWQNWRCRFGPISQSTGATGRWGNRPKRIRPRERSPRRKGPKERALSLLTCGGLSVGSRDATGRLRNRCVPLNRLRSFRLKWNLSIPVKAYRQRDARATRCVKENLSDAQQFSAGMMALRIITWNKLIIS